MAEYVSSHSFTSMLLLGWIANVHFLKGTGGFHPQQMQTTYGQIALFLRRAI